MSSAPPLRPYSPFRATLNRTAASSLPDLARAIAKASGTTLNVAGVERLIILAGQDGLSDPAVRRFAALLASGQAFDEAGRAELAAFVQAASSPPLPEPAVPWGVTYAAAAPGVVTQGRAKPTDIGQGLFLKDCYFLAPAAALASIRPELIESAVTRTARGTYLVRLYDSERRARFLHVAGTLPVVKGLGTSLDAGGGRTRWVPFLEKGYAATLSEGYVSLLDPGYVGLALEALTGRKAWYAPIHKELDGTLLYTSIEKLLKGPPPGCIVANSEEHHTYAVLDVAIRNGERSIQICDPMGWVSWHSIQDFKDDFRNFAWVTL